MKRHKWMMLGASAAVCAALLAPGAFAKDKDDSYRTPYSTVFGTQYERPEPQLPTYGPARFFAPYESENSKK